MSNDAGTTIIMAITTDFTCGTGTRGGGESHPGGHFRLADTVRFVNMIVTEGK